MKSPRLTFTIALSIATLATAAHAETTAKYTLMPSEGFYYQNGQTHPVAPSLTLGLAVAHLWGKFGWVDEADVVSPFTAANPALQLAFGPSYSLSGKIYLAAVGLARYTPEQKGKSDSFMLGGGLVLGMVISREISLGLGVGAGKVASGEPGPWCFTAGPKLSFSLPL